MSIEETFARLAQEKKQRKVNATRSVLNLKKEIENWIGRAYNGDYTYQEALSYIVHKYPTQEITFAESLEYISPELKHEVLRQKEDDPVWYLTEGYANGDTLKNILLLPPRKPSTNERFQKNGYVLFLCEEDGKLSQFCSKGNSGGYSALWTELYILSNSLEAALR
jgi:hypothetical protein